MKATGVVRRIDNLGRIVIPKEIRRNFKITEGDSLEIYVDANHIVLKKFSLLDNMLSISQQLVELVYKIYQVSIMITDREKILSASKEYSGYLNQELVNSLRDKIDSRSEVTVKDNILITSKFGIEDKEMLLIPILANSDILGSVLLVQRKITDEEVNLGHFIASLLVKNVEE